MVNAAPTALVFGEMLFDCYAEGHFLGGAPLNFAWGLRQFGFSVGMVSAVGRDTLGAEILEFLQHADIDATHVLTGNAPTGTARVVQVDGEPQFTVQTNVAWDAIQLSLPMVYPELVYWGTAAQNTITNRATVREILSLSPRHRFFDMNLRQHYYSDELILNDLQNATIIKFNEHEWGIIKKITSSTSPADLLKLFDIKVVAVTLGSKGAELYNCSGVVRATAPHALVVNTTGAGDAFSAALAAGVLRGAAPPQILATACDAGAAVVAHQGAHVQFPVHIVEAFK